MKEFIDRIKVLKETIAELNKSENLTDEQIDRVINAVVESVEEVLKEKDS